MPVDKKLSNDKLAEQQLGERADALGTQGKELFAKLLRKANEKDGTQELITQWVTDSIIRVCNDLPRIDTHTLVELRREGKPGQPPVVTLGEQQGNDTIISGPEVERFNKRSGTNYKTDKLADDYLTFVKRQVLAEMQQIDGKLKDSNGNKLIDKIELEEAANVEVPQTPNTPNPPKNKAKTQRGGKAVI